MKCWVKILLRLAAVAAAVALLAGIAFGARVVYVAKTSYYSLEDAYSIVIKDIYDFLGPKMYINNGFNIVKAHRSIQFSKYGMVCLPPSLHPSYSTSEPVTIKVKGGAKIHLIFTRMMKWKKISIKALYSDKTTADNPYIPLTENYIIAKKEKGIYSCVIQGYSETAKMEAYYYFIYEVE